MKRTLAAAAFAAALVTGPAGSAGAAPDTNPVPTGGTCSARVHLFCRPPCAPDELDCGMLVCFVYVAPRCVVGTY